MRRVPAGQGTAYTARMPRISRLPFVLLHRPRMFGAALAWVALWSILRPLLGQARAILVGFDGAAAAYLVAIAWMMLHTSPAALTRRAERHREGRWSVLVGSLVVSGAVLLAVRTELHASHAAPLPDLLLAGTTIVLSWCFFSLVFAQTYAHADHLARRAGTPALRFPQDGDPDYWDYLYFSAIISMTCQTADVDIAGRGLRHVALLHGTVAFLFNVFIVALTVNVVAGVL